jgi:hypothetical protein
MFDGFEEWRGQAVAAMAVHLADLAAANQAQARAAASLARAVDAYRWPGGVPEPTLPDQFGVEHVQGIAYGEDLTSELAVAHHMSRAGAGFLAGQTATLAHDLPACWEQVTSGRAPLWQARRAAQAAQTLPEAFREQFDQTLAPALGALGPRRWLALVEATTTSLAEQAAAALAEQAAAALAAQTQPADALAEIAPPEPVTDPDPPADRGPEPEPGPPDPDTTVWAPDPQRFAKTGGRPFDPATGWLYARLDRADAIFLDSTIQLLADKLAQQGDTNSLDQRRATALALLANPAAALQLLGVHTTRGLDPAPSCDLDRQALVDAAQALVPALSARTQVYVHLFGGYLLSDYLLGGHPFGGCRWQPGPSQPACLGQTHLGRPGAMARLEHYGPVLASQLHRLTRATHVTLTPVIHTSADTAVDAYEIPAAIRRQVLARQTHDAFPWSSIESRHLDLDHVTPWRPGGPPGQTNPANLAPLSRRGHRVKTHAHWHLEQPRPGIYDWHTPAGQHIRVDYTGSHPTPARE